MQRIFFNLKLTAMVQIREGLSSNTIEVKLVYNQIKDDKFPFRTKKPSLKQIEGWIENCTQSKR